MSIALNYSRSAYNYLSTTNSTTLPRYSTWFGTYAKSRWDIGKAHYLNIANAFSNAFLQFDCSCTSNDYYAYVYADFPYMIFTCGYFWRVALSGSDSQGGTLVHEMSHFTNVAATRDYAYGQVKCKSLAITSPASAIQNADSHEYFSENTPRLN